MITNNAANETPTFQLVKGPQPGGQGEILGLWTISGSPPNERAVEYSAGAADTVAPPVWRVDLPADGVVAAALLEDRETQLQRTHAALPQAEERVECALQEQLQDSTSIDPGTSWLLAELDSGAAISAFGIGDSGIWHGLTGEFDEVAAHTVSMITRYARIETYQGDRPIATTTVSWTSDIETMWQAGVTRAQMRLHLRAIDLTLATRRLWIRLVLLALQTAPKLAGLLQIPGGAVLAAPIAWRLVTRVMDEIAQYQDALLSAGRDSFASEERTG